MLFRAVRVDSAAVSMVVFPACRRFAKQGGCVLLVNSMNTFHQRTKLSHWRCMALGLALLSSVRSSKAQQPNDVPNVEVKSPINTALKLIGEEQAIRNLDSCVATGTLTQGAARGTFTWKTAGQEFWGETIMDSVHVVATSNNGKPLRLENGRTNELAKSTVVNPVPLYNVGMTLLRSKDNTSVSIDTLPPAGDGGSGIRITQARTLDVNIEPAYETWTSDPQTGLPASHTFKPFKYRGRQAGPTTQYKFSGYREVSGVNVPWHLELYMNDQLIRSYDIQSLQCGVQLSTSEFELSGGAK